MLNVFLSSVSQIFQQIKEILVTGRLRCSQIHLSIQGNRRVQQLLIRKALGVYLQFIKWLACNGIPHNRTHHRHIACLNLLRLIPVLDCQVAHSECSGTWLYEPRIPALRSILYQIYQVSLFHRTQASQEHLSWVSKKCHRLSTLPSLIALKKAPYPFGCDAVVFGPEPCDEQGLNYGIVACCLHQLRILY